MQTHNIRDMFASNEYKDVVTRLKFVSKIQAGEKINTKHYLAIVNDDWLTAVLRKFYNFESRSQSISFINDTITAAFRMIDKIKSMDNENINTHQIDSTNILCNLFRDLFNAKIGITNLIKTYKTDKIIVCQLETIVENIDLFLVVNNVNI